MTYGDESNTHVRAGATTAKVPTCGMRSKGAVGTMMTMPLGTTPHGLITMATEQAEATRPIPQGRKSSPEKSEERSYQRGSDLRAISRSILVRHAPKYG